MDTLPDTTDVLSSDELIALFEDISYPGRKLGLVAPPIEEMTKAGLIKGPSQMNQEIQTVGLTGALIVGCGNEVEDQGGYVGSYAYVRDGVPQPELMIDRENYRLMVFDIALIACFREK